MIKSRIITITMIMAALVVSMLTACNNVQESSVEETAAAAESQTTAIIEEHTASYTAPRLAEETETAGDVGIEKVQSIVLDMVPGATVSDIYEMEKEYDDGRLEYEGSLYYDGYEYEFEVDGATGNILQWEIDD